MTKFKVNGLQIEYKDVVFSNDGISIPSILAVDKLKGDALASVKGANGNVKIDIKTLSEDTQEQIKQLLKNIELEVNGEQLTKNLIIVDKEYTDKFTKTGLATLHKGEVFLNKKQFDELMKSAEKIKGISISNEDKSENVTLTEGKIYHTKEIKSEQIKGHNLKDQTINLTVNIDGLVGNGADVEKLASKIEELTWKAIKDNKNLR